MEARKNRTTDTFRGTNPVLAKIIAQSVDLEGKFHHVNGTWADAFGYSTTDLSHLTVFDVLDPLSRSAYEEVLQDLIHGGEGGLVEMQYVTRDRQRFVAEVNITPLFNGEGVLMGTCELLAMTLYIDGELQRGSTKEVPEYPARVFEAQSAYQGSMLQALEDPYSPMNMFLDSIHDLVFYKDLEGVYRGCNKHFAQLLKLPKEKILGRTDYELYPKEVADFFVTRDRMIQEDLLPRRNEEWVTQEDGTRSYIETMKTPYRGPDGELLGYLGISRDITERKIAEEKLVDNEKWLNIYFSQSLNAKYFMMLDEPQVWDDAVDKEALLERIFQNMRMTRVNQAMLNQYGMTEEMMLRSTPLDVFKGNPQKSREIWRELLDQGHAHAITKELKASGEEIFVDADYMCLYDEEGRIIGAFGTQRDITRETVTEAKMREREKYLRTIIETTQDGFFVVDGDRNIIDVNESYCRMSGYSKEELLGMRFSDLDGQWPAKELRMKIMDIIVKGSEIFESRHVRKDGTLLDVEISATWLGDKEHTLVCFCRDITERKQLESYFLIEKEQFKNTLHAAADGLISTDREGKIIIMNQIAEELTGVSYEDALNQPLEDVLPVVDETTGQRMASPALAAMASGKTLEFSKNHRLLVKGGEPIYIECSVAPIKGTQEEITGAVVVFKDVTQRREEMRNIEFLSFHDPLTGLYNRRYMEETFERLREEKSLPLTVMVIDVNGLKLTNDAFGHSKGDSLLKNVARICKEVSRTDDIICRTGGDEFVLILPNTDRAQAKALKDRIVTKAGKTEYDIMFISLAIGFSVMTILEQNIQEIYEEADTSMYKNKVKYGKIMRRRTIDLLLKKLNAKYDESESHNRIVAEYAEGLARARNLSKKDVEDIMTAALMHDIGKVMIPSEILMKADRLTPGEMKEIRKHPETGYQILKGVDDFSALSELILCHHERWDGKGYPRGLKGTEIPLGARIIAVADAFETMTGDRSYRMKKTVDEAVEELQRMRGTQFDPDMVDLFIAKVLKR